MQATRCPNVRFYLEKIRGERPLEEIISPRSLKNLQRAANVHPKRIGRLLFLLEKLHYLAIVPRLEIPKAASFRHNREALRDLTTGGLGYLKELMGEEDILDLHKLGLRGKEREGVRRVLEILRGDREIRDLISSESEENLVNLALNFHNETRAFLRNLLSLKKEDRPSKIIVPGNLGWPHNIWILKKLGADREFLLSLKDEAGVLDLRKAGLKNAVPYIDLTPSRKPATLEDYRAILIGSVSEFQRDPALGNLFLFKAILKTRSDLYVAGEARSAALKKGQDPAVVPDFKRLMDFLGLLLEKFPFGTIGERQQMREGIEVASMLLAKNNNPAADAKLSSVFDHIERVLTRQIIERTRIKTVSPQKITYVGRGVWKILTTGYRRTPSGMMRKERVESKVRTPELLSKLQHVIDSTRQESDQNAQFSAQLEFIKARLPGYFDKLFDLHDRFKDFDAIRKEKVYTELEGTLQLVRVGSEQALRLAVSLINLAENDIELRQEEIGRQRERYEALKNETEAQIGEKVIDFAMLIASGLADDAVLFDPAAIAKAEKRLGGYLGSFLKGTIREDWLRRIKSRVVGTKNALAQVKAKLSEKIKLMEGKKSLRAEFERRWKEIWASSESREEKGRRLGQLRAESLGAMRDLISQVNKLNDEMIDALRKAAKHILSVRIDHDNRHEEVTNAEQFFLENAFLLAPFDRMNRPQVEAVGKRGEKLGRLSRKEAEIMGLNYEELSA
jgi:hypothetical protein